MTRSSERGTRISSSLPLSLILSRSVEISCALVNVLRTKVAIDLATVASQNLLHFRGTSAFLDGYQASALRESIVVAVRDLKRSADTVPFCEAAVARPGV